MRKQLMRVAIATMISGALFACADNDRGGGGGGDAKTQRAVHDDRAQHNGNDMGDQLRANLTTDLTTEGRDFTEAYARVPWVHANIAAGDWERALDDLQFVDHQVNDMSKDHDISAPIKAKIVTVKPTIAQLTQQIQKHDRASLKTATALLDHFASLTNDPALLAWIGDRTKGGGAGR